MKLLLCSGPGEINGEWVRLDADPLCTPDILATIPPLPFKVLWEGWDEIALIHGIEHFYLWDAEELLRECRAALNQGGKMILEQPNILFAAHVLIGDIAPLTGTVGQSDMWPLYGDPTHRNPLFCHRWGWTPKSLTAALKKAGFGLVVETEPQTHLKERDFRLEAYA